MIRSAGLLLYRPAASSWEVLLVHPSGNYNRVKPWSIPKGVPNEDEDLEAAARRETREETGVDHVGPLQSLGDIRYKKSRKEVHAWAGAAAAESAPRCASWEVDRAEFVSLDEARRVLHPDQQPFIDRLIALLTPGP